MKLVPPHTYPNFPLVTLPAGASLNPAPPSLPVATPWRSCAGMGSPACSDDQRLRVFLGSTIPSNHSQLRASTPPPHPPTPPPPPSPEKPAALSWCRWGLGDSKVPQLFPGHVVGPAVFSVPGASGQFQEWGTPYLAGGKQPGDQAGNVGLGHAPARVAHTDEEGRGCAWCLGRAVPSAFSLRGVRWCVCWDQVSVAGIGWLGHLRGYDLAWNESHPALHRQAVTGVPAVLRVP